MTKPQTAETVLVERGPITHDLKTWPGPFAAVKAGRKTFEYRRNDRDFREGDTLRLREWEPLYGDYTGDTLTRTVGYVLIGGQYGIPAGYGIMAFSQPLPREGEWTRETLGRAIYLALYEHQGAVWAANDSKEVWYAVADRMLAAAPPPHDGRGEVEDETAWLIEETWSGFVHYVHKDFNCAKWAEENRKNDASRRNGMPPRYPAVLITKDIEQAMRFPTEDAAHTWLAMQPCWMNGGGPEDQYQVREHMWSSPTDWKARAETAEAQLAEAKGEVERLKNELAHEGEHQRQCAVEWFNKFRAAEAQRDRLLEAGKRLSFAAQTSGGVAGRDEGLVAAIDGFARATGETQ